MKHNLKLIFFVFIPLLILLDGCGPSITVSNGSTKHKTTNNKTNSGGQNKKSNNKGSNGSKSGGSTSSISKKLGIQVTSSDNQKLYSEAASWIGTPYKYGGTSRAGVDCSGFTYLMYQSVYSKKISRQSAEILDKNCKKINKKDLREGDLVFFRTDGKRSSTPNHVGIYLKNNKFIHSSTSKGVVVSDLTSQYYIDNWIAAGRVR